MPIALKPPVAVPAWNSRLCLAVSPYRLSQFISGTDFSGNKAAVADAITLSSGPSTWACPWVIPVDQGPDLGSGTAVRHRARPARAVRHGLGDGPTAAAELGSELLGR